MVETEEIKTGLKLLEDKKYEEVIKLFENLLCSFTQSKNDEYISVTMSLLGMSKYLSDKTLRLEATKLINDASYMAQTSKSQTAKYVNEYAKGTVEFGENNSQIALKHFQNALQSCIQNEDILNIAGYIQTRINQVKNGLSFEIPIKSDPLVSLVKIGRSITAVTDIDVLLKVIAEETKIAIQADRCTVFLLDKEKNELWSKIALGIESSEIRFPADKGLAGYVVKTGEPLNITDAYQDERFNPDIDKKTGYHTKTILCMPIKNNNQEIIGAFQVLNKQNGVFTKSDEDLLVAIGGSASIALENAQLFEQQKELYKEQKALFESFIDTLATSIDARDKITSGHSLRVRLYALLLAQQMNCDSKFLELLEKAAILHDIGKIGIRDSVLQKEGKLTDEEYKHIQEHVRITHDILNKLHMSKDFELVTEMACSHHEKYDGSGYYRHLKGEEITFGGRVLAVADVFDAITSKRHYRDKMPIRNVIDILISGKDKHFDGKMVDEFLKISLDKIISVFLTENNVNIEEKDIEILSQYNLKYIYDLIGENDDNEIVKLFNFYYMGGQ